MGLAKRKNRLAFWRKVRGLSQEELARVLRVSSGTIGRWERDETVPARQHAETMARLLRVNIRELFPFTWL